MRTHTNMMMLQMFNNRIGRTEETS